MSDNSPASTTSQASSAQEEAKKSVTKTVNIGGKEVEFFFDEDPNAKAIEDLTNELYKTHKIKEDPKSDDSRKENSIFLQIKTAYEKIRDDDEGGEEAAKEWAKDLKEALESKKKLFKDRENIFKNSDLAHASYGKLTPSIAGIEASRNLVKVGDFKASPITGSDQIVSFRNRLREDPALSEVKAGSLDKSIIREINGAKLDVAIQIDNNDEKIAYLLSGNRLNEEIRAKLAEADKIFSGDTKNSILDLVNEATDWALNGGNPQEFKGAYADFSQKLRSEILSNPKLDPRLSNAFFEKIEASKLGNEKLLESEKELLKKYSDAEDKERKAKIEALDKSIQEYNESFYKNLKELSKEEHKMIPGKLLRILLMANPFLGGILTGLAILQPLMAVLDNVKSFNDLVLSPIKLIFGDHAADAIKSAFSKATKVPVLKEVTGVLDVPNQLIEAATQNPISKSITGSMGNVFKGEIVQMGIAAAALVYDFEKRMAFNKKTNDKLNLDADPNIANEGFNLKGLKAKIDPEFGKDGNQDKRRKEQIQKFATENAVPIYEAKTMNLEGAAKNVANAFEENQAKILANLLGAGADIINSEKFSLENFLKDYALNPKVKQVLVLSEMGKLDDLKKALNNTESFDKLLKDTKEQTEKFIQEKCYGNLSGSDLEAKKQSIIDDYRESLLSYNNNHIKVDEVKRENKGNDTASTTKGPGELMDSAQEGGAEKPNDPKAEISAEQKKSDFTLPSSEKLDSFLKNTADPKAEISVEQIDVTPKSNKKPEFEKPEFIPPSSKSTDSPVASGSFVDSIKEARDKSKGHILG